MSDTIRRSVLCKKCGGDIFSRTYQDTPELSFDKPVWKCENCGAETPRTSKRRRTNHHRAIDAYLKLKDEWKPIDEQLDGLVTAGRIKSGALLVYASTFNYHMKQLVDVEKPSNWDVRYHIAEARKEMQQAADYVKENSK